MTGGPEPSASLDRVPSEGASGVDRGRRSRTLLWLLLVALLGVGLWAVRWEMDRSPASGDTFWYARAAFEFGGMGQDEATAAAARLVVRMSGHGSEAGWRAAPATVDRRYQGIFTERPFYPATAALLGRLVGSDGLMASAALAGVVIAVTLGWFVARMTGSRVAAVLGVVLLYALPSGASISFLYADGWMLAFWTASLVAGTTYLDGGSRRWLLLVLVAMTLLCVTKSANASVLAMTLVATAVLALATRHPDGRRAIGLAVAGGAVVGIQVAVFSVLGLPGLTDSVQDYFTGHFTTPDVQSPFVQLLIRDLRLTPRWIAGLASTPLTLVSIVGLAGLVRVRRLSAWIWILGAILTAVLVLLHPVASEAPRLLAPVWVSVALGISIWIAPLVRSDRPPAPWSVGPPKLPGRGRRVRPDVAASISSASPWSGRGSVRRSLAALS